MTVYRRRLVLDSFDGENFGLRSVFFCSGMEFSKLTSLFWTLTVFIHTYGYCASVGEGFIAFGGQDVENEHGEVS